MTTEVLNSFTALQNELNQAKNSLKDYDENIKRLIGRDPSESGSRNNISKRPVINSGLQNDDFSTRRYNENNVNNFQLRQRQQQIFTSSTKSSVNNDEPPLKKRSMDSSVFKRLDKIRSSDDDLYPNNKLQMHSRVIVTPREVPSRQDALKLQDRDEKSKARNRRMFGALLGTLQKFRQEETKLKTKEDKRAQVEKKLEEQEVLEKAKIKKERYELFLGRKKKQQQIRIIEQKMLRIKEQAFWEEQNKLLMNFIRTEAKPHIYYLPRKMTPKTTEILNSSKEYTKNLIDEKREQLKQELEVIENRFKKDKDVEDGELDEHDEIHEMLNAAAEETVAAGDEEHKTPDNEAKIVNETECVNEPDDVTDKIISADDNERTKHDSSDDDVDKNNSNADSLNDTETNCNNSNPLLETSCSTINDTSTSFLV